MNIRDATIRVYRKEISAYIVSLWADRYRCPVYEPVIYMVDFIRIRKLADIDDL